MVKRTDVRQTTLKIIAEESAMIHKKLLQKRRAKDLFYAPDPSRVYVWELKTTRTFENQHRHTYTQLFVTREIAFEAASRDVVTWFKERHGEIYDERANKLFMQDRHEELIEYVMTHYTTWEFTVAHVAVAPSAMPIKFSDPGDT